MFSGKTTFSWIEIAVALFPGTGMLILLSLFEQQFYSDRYAVLTLVQATIATAFGSVFFGMAWSRLPIKYESEFLTWRFDDAGAPLLAIFRNLLLFFVVIPLMMALIICAIVDSGVVDLIDRDEGVQWITGIMLVFAFFNSIKNRIITDFAVGAINLLAMLSIVCLLIFGQFDVSSRWVSDFASIAESVGFSDWCWSILVVWWFSSVVDMPDMRAQKLLSMEAGNTRMNPVVLAVLVLFACQGLFIAIAPDCQKQTIVFTALLLLLSLNGLIGLLNLQHWSGLVFMQGVLERKTQLQKSLFLRCFVMCLSTLLAFLYLNWLQTGSHLMMQFVFFSAGVGPVYVLRWTWWRINAWTQLAAMIGALFIGFFWLDIMNILSPGLDTKNSLWWNIVVPGALNCCIWISVLFITRNSSKQWSSLKKIARAGVLRSLYCFRCWWYFIALSCASLLLLFWSGIPILFSRFYHFLLD